MFSLGPGIAYSVAAAFVWGTYIFVLKRYFRGYPGTVLTVGSNAAAVAWYLPLVTLRSRTEWGPAPGPAPLAWAAFADPLGTAVVVVTVFATATAFLAFLRAIDVGEVSYTVGRKS